MIDLLQVVSIDTDKAPLMLELPVDPNVAPYLLSSSKYFIWKNKPFPNNMVRVAVRTEHRDTLYSEIVQLIYDTGIACEWENSYPLSEQGIEKAIDYLKYYGIPTVEILSSEENPLSLGKSFKGYTVRIVDWLHNCYAIVPMDKSFLGSISSFGGDRYAVLVHNPSRGIAFSL